MESVIDWYGAVGCELCPCSKNPELHKINDHQVDMITDRTADRPRSGRRRVTRANEDSHLRILHFT